MACRAACIRTGAATTSHTAVVGGRVSRTVQTQVGRALAQLGVDHIAAYSPEARGRSERAFRTLQDRLPKELALAGIGSVAAANAWLRAVYVAQHNGRFAVAAEQAGSAFVPVSVNDLREALCHEELRPVGQGQHGGAGAGAAADCGQPAAGTLRAGAGEGASVCPMGATVYSMVRAALAGTMRLGLSLRWRCRKRLNGRADEA